jgi:hypothetical protein
MVSKSAYRKSKPHWLLRPSNGLALLGVGFFVYALFKLPQLFRHGYGYRNPPAAFKILLIFLFLAFVFRGWEKQATADTDVDDIAKSDKDDNGNTAD